MRCAEAAHCGTDHLCIKLGEDTELLRIQYRVTEIGHIGSEDTALKTLVWSGPRTELLEEGKRACASACSSSHLTRS